MARNPAGPTAKGQTGSPLALVEPTGRVQLSDAPTPKGRRRQSDLLDAARSTFADQGYFETRVEDIAQRAHVSRATFYTYFDSKDDILAVLVEQLVDDLYEASAAPQGRGTSPYLMLESTVRQFMHAYRDRAPMIRVFEQAVSLNPSFLALRIEVRARFGLRLTAAIRQRLLATGDVALDAELAGYALGGMVDDFARGCYILNQLVDEGAAIDTLTRIWARAIGLPEPAE